MTRIVKLVLHLTITVCVNDKNKYGWIKVDTYAPQVSFQRLFVAITSRCHNHRVHVPRLYTPYTDEGDTGDINHTWRKTPFPTAGKPPNGSLSPKIIRQYHVPIKLLQYLFLYSSISVVGTSLNILLTTNANRTKNGAQISQHSKKS